MVNDVIDSSDLGTNGFGKDSGAIVDIDTSTNRILETSEIATLYFDPKDDLTSIDFTITGSLSDTGNTSVDQTSYTVTVDLL